MLPDINFQNIRCHKKSQNLGFEELCVQLFRHSFLDETIFYRVDDGGGDGGVEDIALLENDKKVGLQAKYFNCLENSQWQQIDKSVKTAIDNHPTLIEYRITTPVNRKKDDTKWTSRIEKWNEYAKTKGFKHKIKFVWWDDTELRDLLSSPAHISKVYREGAFGKQSQPFLGWLMLVEDCEKSRSTVASKEPHFPVFPEFKTASYAERYDLLCQKLMQEKLYTSATTILSPRTARSTGAYSELSELTGLKNFVITLASHISAEAAR